MDVKKFIRENKLSYDDVVRLLKPQFKSFAKSTLSCCVNEDRYGVTLSPRAIKALGEAFPEKKVNRKKGHQLTVRVDDELYDMIQYECQDRLLTVQDFLERTIKYWMINY